MSLKVSKKSWHYKLAYKSLTQEIVCASRYVGLDNLCDYMRRVCKVLLALSVVGWFFSVTPFIVYNLWTMHIVLPSGGVPTELTYGWVLFGIWLLVGTGANVLVALCIGAVAALGVFALIGSGLSIGVAAVAAVPVMLLGEQNKASTSFALIKGWMSAVKDKMCPLIEIVD